MTRQRLRDLMRDATDDVSADPAIAERAWGARGTRRRAPLLAVAAAMACAATVVGVVVVVEETDRASPGTTLSSDGVMLERTDGRPEVRGLRPTAADRRVAKRFIAFARASTKGVGGVRFAPGGVEIGLGNDLVRTVAGQRLDRVGAWKIRHRAWRGHSGGPLSALSTLRRNDDRPLHTIVERAGRCAFTSRPPTGVAGLRRVAIEPRAGTSCLNWFEVSLYVDDEYRIHAVTLDLWEP